MSYKFPLSILLTILCIGTSAQEFRGLVTTKQYAEKGEIKVAAPYEEELIDGVITLSSLNTRKVDTVYHEYHICKDTVFHLKQYDSESLKANSAQLGGDFIWRRLIMKNLVIILNS